MVAPPEAGAAGWTVTSEAANRPLRTQLIVDGASGRVLARKDFAERQWIDRLVGYGIAIHEGAVFGLSNHIAATLTALLLVVLSVPGPVMCLRRPPGGRPRRTWPLLSPPLEVGPIAGHREPRRPRAGLLRR